VMIDRAPIAANETGTDVVGTTLTVSAAAGVLANDTDPDGDTLSVSGVSDTANGAGTVDQPLTGSYGKLTLNTDGSFSYDLTSTPTTAVQDIFTYTVSDGKGGTASATLTLNFVPNPTANPDTASVLEGQTIAATTSATGVLGNDTEPNNAYTLTVTGFSDTANGAGTLGQSLAGTYGHLTLNAAGTYSYVADITSAINSAATGSHPQDVFTYTETDGHG